MQAETGAMQLQAEDTWACWGHQQLEEVRTSACRNVIEKVSVVLSQLVCYSSCGKLTQMGGMCKRVDLFLQFPLRRRAIGTSEM